MPGRFLGVVALAAGCALLTACSQNAAGQSKATTSPQTSASPVASPSSVPSASAPASPSSVPSAASQSPSPVPPNAVSYATAADAGIAGVEAKTGLTYVGGCTPPILCIGTPQVFGNTGAGGYDAAYVQVGWFTSGTQNCFAYVFFASGGWHFTQPVVCPQQGGYNPVVGATDHVVVPGACANVRVNPGLSSKVVTCLKDATVVSIDPDLPRYVDGHIWWSINGHQGWMAHDFLITASPPPPVLNLTGVAAQMYPYQSVGYMPCDQGHNDPTHGYSHCPVTARLLNQLLTVFLGVSSPPDPLGGGQDPIWQAESITADESGTGGVAHIMLTKSSSPSSRYDLVIIMSGGNLLVDDLYCTGANPVTSSIYASGWINRESC